MATSFTTTSLSSALKYVYTDRAVGDLVYNKKHRAFFSKVSKNFDGGGNSWNVAVVSGDPVGLSADLATAQAGRYPSVVNAFSVTWKQSWASQAIDTALILQAKKDKHAFVNAVKHMIDRSINAFANRIAGQLFRRSDGRIGQIANSVAATTGSATFSLQDAGDISNFHAQDILVAFASASLGPRADTGTTTTSEITVQSVNRSTGQITATQTLHLAGGGSSALTGSILGGHFLAQKGDYTAAVANPGAGLCIAGLDDWLDSAPSSGESFYGVDRSTDPARLAGIAITGSAADIEGAIYDGASQIARNNGGNPTVAIMSYETMRNLNNQLEASGLFRKTGLETGGKASSGYSSIVVFTPAGEIECIADSFCPDKTVYILDMSTWELVSCGKGEGGTPIQFDNEDGLILNKLASSGGYELRMTSLCNLVCHAPGHNARATLS